MGEQTNTEVVKQEDTDKEKEKPPQIEEQSQDSEYKERVRAVCASVREALVEAGSVQQALGAAKKNALHSVFSDYDLDESGEIDKTEFIDCMKQVGVKLS